MNGIKGWVKETAIFIIILLIVTYIVGSANYEDFKFVVAFAIASVIVDLYLRNKQQSWPARTYYIRAWDAILKHKKFGQISGIKSALEGKGYYDWSDADQKKYREDKKISDLVENVSYVRITYLPSDNIYYINPTKEKSYVVHREINASNLLYSRVVAGDQEMEKEHLLFAIYERLPDGIFGKSKPILSVCLIYRRNSMDIKQELTILCDFPLLLGINLSEKEFKKFGFEIEKGFADVSEDIFGQQDLTSFPPSYTKAGVNISIID